MLNVTSVVKTGSFVPQDIWPFWLNSNGLSVFICWNFASLLLNDKQDKWIKPLGKFTNFSDISLH